MSRLTNTQFLRRNRPLPPRETAHQDGTQFISSRPHPTKVRLLLLQHTAAGTFLLINEDRVPRIFWRIILHRKRPLSDPSRGVSSWMRISVLSYVVHRLLFMLQKGKPITTGYSGNDAAPPFRGTLEPSLTPVPTYAYDGRMSM